MQKTTSTRTIRRNARSIWELYPKLFAKPPYGDTWQNDPNEPDPPVHDDEDSEPEIDETGLSKFDIDYERKKRLIKKVFNIELENIPVMVKCSINLAPLSDAVKIARNCQRSN